MQRRLFINPPPSLRFSPSFLPSFLLSFLFPSLCLHPAKPDVQTSPAPNPLCPLTTTMPPFLSSLGASATVTGGCYSRGATAKQLALTHRAAAALQIVSPSQIVARNYTLPGDSEGVGATLSSFYCRTDGGVARPS